MTDEGRNTSGTGTPGNPTVEVAFEQYLELCHRHEVPDTRVFVAGQPAAIRAELQRIIADFGALRQRFTEPRKVLRPGLEAGGYRLGRELGRGGMGVVYEAREMSSDRAVALKVLSAEYEYSDEAYERFEREARLAAAISHPRCVFVYGVTEIEGQPAIAMEQMTGETLQDQIASGRRVSVGTAVDWMLQVIDGLEAACRAGVIHRDVKPSNCFLTEDGGVKIGDFGISRTLELGGHLTRTGQFLGSPYYASPEQVRGDPLDVRTDIYSVGATLYALLAGHPPFEATGLGEILARILSDPAPSVRAVRTDVPRGLARVLKKAMAKKPEDRFKDHDSLRRDLSLYGSSEWEPAYLAWRFAASTIDSIGMSVIIASVLSSATGYGFIDALFIGNMAGESISLGLAALAMGIAYYALLEGLRGATIGKALLGMRVVSVCTSRPSVPRALLRVSILYAFQSGTIWLSMFGVWSTSRAVQVSLLGLLPLVSMRRRNGWRGLHGLASGTCVVMRAPVEDRARRFNDGVFDPERPLAPGAPPSVGEFVVRGPIGPSPRGRWLLAEDARLGREVWLHLLNDPCQPLDVARSVHGLRWLQHTRDGEREADVFEAVRGASIMEYRASQHSLPWPEAYQVLRELAEALGRPEAPDSVERLWIDGEGHLQVLPLPFGAEPPRALVPMELLRDAAQILLYGSVARPRYVPRYSRAARLAPFAIPVAAPEPPLDPRTKEPHIDRAAAVRRAAVVSMWPRGTDLLTGEPHVPRTTGVVLALVFDDGRTPLHKLPADLPLSAEPLVRRLVGLAQPFADMDGLLAALADLSQRTQRLTRARRVAALLPPLSYSFAAVMGSLFAVSSFAPEGVPFIEDLTRALVAALTYALIYTAASGVFAFAFRGGLSLWFAGISLRRTMGRVAPRRLCLGRSLVTSLPVAFLLFIATVTAQGRWSPGGPLALVGLSTLLILAGVVVAIVSPRRGIQDRLVGTYLVPR